MTIDNDQTHRRWADQQPPLMAEVEIPGTVTAYYNFETGALDFIAFTPHAGSAGHFGDSAIIGDVYRQPADAVDAEERAEVEHQLDVEDVDGTFWRAVQAACQDPASVQGSDALAYCIGWTE